MIRDHEIGNPYVGLRPFQAEESLLFFGRREQTAELLERLHETRFLAVVGGSGCGKSSLILAGLIPALRGGFLVEDRDRWVTATMRPGNGPIRNLAAALCRTSGREPGRDEIQALQEATEEDPREAERLVTSVVGKDRNLLLLVDQFEEIFSFRGKEDVDQALALSREARRDLGSRRAEAADFVDLMLRLSRVDAPVYVVMTMRTDFLGDCDLFDGLPEAVNRSGFLVPRLDREQLRQVIEGPARLSGARMAPRLRDLLLNKLGDRFDLLPVLQHGLLRTWDIWHGNGEGMIDLDSYRAAGTLSHGLSKHANEALREEDEKLTATIFKCLTDTDSSHRRVRRPVKMSELIAVTGAEPHAINVVLERFCEGGRSFLVISDSAATGDPRIDISHESLIRQWDRLKLWVDEERESRDQFLDLAERARKRGRVGGALLQRADLRLFLSWWNQANPTKAWAQRYCKQEDDFEAAKSYLEESRKDVEAAARLRKRNKRLLYSATVLTMLILAVAFIWARSAARSAEGALSQANLNLARLFEEKAGFALWAASRDKQLGESPADEYQQAWLYTLAALTRESELNEKLPKSLGRLLLSEMRPSRAWTSGVEPTNAPVVGLEFGSDGKLLAATVPPPDEGSQSLHLLDVSSKPSARGAQLYAIGEASVWCVTFSPDARLLAAGLTKTKVLLWKTGQTRPLGVLQDVGNDEEVVSDLAFSNDGALLAAGLHLGNVIVWDTRELKELQSFKHELDEEMRLTSVAFNRDARILATGAADSSVCLWNMESGKPTCREFGGETSVSSMAFSPRDDLLAVGMENGAVHLWDAATQQDPRSLAGSDRRVSSIAFDPVGTMFVSGHGDGSLRFLDLASGRLLAMVNAHTESVENVVFGNNGATVASGSSDRTVRRIDLEAHLIDGSLGTIRFRDLITGTVQFDALYALSLDRLQYELPKTDLIAESLETIDMASATYFGAEINDLEFKRSNLILRSDREDGFPRFDDDTLVLTPDQQRNKSGVALLKADVRPPFRISFEYSTYNQQYPVPWNSRWKTADGIVLMFLKNRDAYADEKMAPPAGGKTGFVHDGTGYGVRFGTFDQRAIQLFADDSSQGSGKRVLRTWSHRSELDQAKQGGFGEQPIGDIYTGGEWRGVTIEVGSASVTVRYEGLPVITWQAELNTDHAGIGFGAATGGEVSEHRIRNVRLERLDEEPVVIPAEREQRLAPPTALKVYRTKTMTKSR